MTLKSRLLGHLAYALTWFLAKTLRVTIVKHPEYMPTTPYLFAFWHGKQLLPVMCLSQHQTRRAVLVSPSRDGDLLSVCLTRLGYEVVRGSSRHRNVESLVSMMRKLKAGCSLGFGVDGPIGPLHQVKPGMTHLAQKFGIAIIPVGSAFERAFIFEKAWDKFAVPKPFSKATLYLGKPMHILPDVDLHLENRTLEKNIHETEAKALALLAGR
jgi:lysophospholipid acyltransferase (LPLAT)-like uncharacterized protein